MTAQPPFAPPFWRDRAFPLAAAVVGALTLARLVALAATGLNLGPDEAQYWWWSLDPGFGYVTKPPLIAWVIAATTAVCGDGEACVRSAAPFFHGATALVLFGLAYELYGSRVALWTALAYATMPAVSLGSGLMTTDTPLLFFWSCALFAFHRSVAGGGLAWALAAGAALGLGLLTKYAAAYFLLGAALLIVLSPAVRAWARTPAPALILGTAALFLAPNLLWNVATDFAAASHVAANAHWGGELFNPGELLDFAGSQFGVFGPVLMGALLWGFATWRTRTGQSADSGRADLFLAAFCAPILLIVCGQAFISRANANWAAPAYAAGTVLVTAWLVRSAPAGWRIGSLAVNGSLAAALLAFMLSPALIEAAGRTNDFKRLRGWDVLGERLGRIAVREDAAVILSDDREDASSILYYARGSGVPVRVWAAGDGANNQYELVLRYAGAPAGPVLYATRRDDPTPVTNAFLSARLVEEIETPIGGGRTRALTLYRLEGFRGASAPAR